MSYIEIDFIGVETSKSGDAITIRYEKDGIAGVHVVDGGYIDTGAQLIEQLQNFYGTTRIQNVVLTHPDRDHANGLRAVLEECDVGTLWLNRPWLYAGELLHRFSTYTSTRGALARSDTNVANLLISLFKALGGGWEQKPEGSKPGSATEVAVKG